MSFWSISCDIFECLYLRSIRYTVLLQSTVRLVFMCMFSFWSCIPWKKSAPWKITLLSTRALDKMNMVHTNSCKSSIQNAGRPISVVFTEKYNGRGAHLKNDTTMVLKMMALVFYQWIIPIRLHALNFSPIILYLHDAWKINLLLKMVFPVQYNPCN